LRGAGPEALSGESGLDRRGSRRLPPPLLGLAVVGLAFLPLATGVGATAGLPVVASEPALDMPHQWLLFQHALYRIPLAAVLGAALAFRPRRRGTPPRSPAVMQTQILLALVGAIVMLVVGSSVARAFGIVGAASLVRYRAKIADPKDAGIMLSTLGIGLASGVGLYLLAGFATLVTLGVVWILESLEPEGHRLFNLKIKSKAADELKPRVESILSRNRVGYDLRSSNGGEVVYEVRVPLEKKTERLSNAILGLDPEGGTAVEWGDKKNGGKT
jgi:uncharacterized membrane protein YhiD involved in acid resistance